MCLLDVIKIKKAPRPGIEPGSPAWQAGILTTILTRICLSTLLTFIQLKPHFHSWLDINHSCLIDCVINKLNKMTEAGPSAIKNRVNAIDVSTYLNNHWQCVYSVDLKLLWSNSMRIRRRCSCWDLSVLLWSTMPPRPPTISWRRWSRTWPTWRRTSWSCSKETATKSTS